MSKNCAYILWFLCVSVILQSCVKDEGYVEVEPDLISPVTFVLDSVPYLTLSEYNFFEGDLNGLDPVYGVLPFTLNSTLFTDFAKKKRFIWMPSESSASYVNDFSILDFPIGTVLIKNFYYNNVMPNNNTKIIETRVIYKNNEDRWSFANYRWNDEQTEAYYTTDGEVVDISWLENGVSKSVNYEIPSPSKCVTCHGDFNGGIPIGVKPQNLNLSYNYIDGAQNQLSKWADMGYLIDDFPTTIESTVDWKDESKDLELRVRSYFDINCAHCHNAEGYCNYALLRLEFKNTESLVNLGVCVSNDFYLGNEVTHIVNPGDANSSALFYRINTIEEEFRMPFFGRTLIDPDGVALVDQWINSLNINCN